MKDFRIKDICLPDYFQGYAGHVWVVLVDSSSSATDIIEEVENDDGWFGSSVTEPEFDAALIRLKGDKELLDKWLKEACKDIEDDEDSKSVYAYIVLD